MDWTQIAYYCLSILAGIIVALANVLAQKTKKAAKEPEKIPESIKDYCIEAVEEAETTGLKGTMKKAFAVSLIVIKCASLGVNYGSIEALISDYIDTLVALTKKVN